MLSRYSSSLDQSSMLSCDHLVLGAYLRLRQVTLKINAAGLGIYENCMLTYMYMY